MRDTELFPCRARGAALAVCGLWLFAAGAIAAALLLSFWAWAGFLLPWGAAVAAFLRLRFGGLTVAERDGRLTVTRGTLFPTETTLPARGAVMVSRISTPLMRRCGGCILLLRVAGQWLVLPGMPDACGDAIAQMGGR